MLVRVSLQGEPSLSLLIYSFVFVAAETQGSCPILWVTTSYYLCQCSKGPTFDSGGAITETSQGTPAWATYVSEITGQSGGPGSDGALSCLGQMIRGCLPPAWRLSRVDRMHASPPPSLAAGCRQDSSPQTCSTSRTPQPGGTLVLWPSTSPDRVTLHLPAPAFLDAANRHRLFGKALGST